jgi:hypothetical protein
MMMFLWPGITAMALPWVIAGWAIATGILEILVAVRLRKEIANEWFRVLHGLLSLVSGVVLISDPTWERSGVHRKILDRRGRDARGPLFRIKSLASSGAPPAA